MATRPADGDAPTMTPAARDFLAANRFAVLATIDPDGAPHQAVVWYRLDGNELVVNSAEGRRWPANLRRDPRIHLTVEDGYRYVQVRGRVAAVIDDQAIAQADIAEMARRYHADDGDEADRLIRDRFTKQHRVSFRIRPERVAEDL
jgi:PPOX class probable F420-dependent enzyme